MGRKSAASPYERRRWLEQLEKGSGITRIAEAAGRDIRAVKRHIELAREERLIGEVKTGFLLGRLEQHQEDLLADAAQLRGLIYQFPPVPLAPAGPVPQKIHAALREHTARLPLKGLLESYERATEKFSLSRENVNRELNEKETELKSKLTSGIDTYPWSADIVWQLESAPSERGFSVLAYGKEQRGEEMWVIHWGSNLLVRSPIPDSRFQAIGKTIEAAHKNLLSFAERYWPVFHEHRHRLSELAAQIAEELDVFAIKRLIPGHCRYCPI